MTTKKELFAAVQLLRKHCRESECNDCVLRALCYNSGEDNCIGDSSPCFWPDPEEGGSEDAQ